VSGSVQGIFIAPVASESMQGQASVKAIAGAGLENDRYAMSSGFYSPTPTTPGARGLTLIAREAIDAAAEAAGVTFEPIESRRNIVTQGVDLKALLGKRFTIGAVVCEGVRDCPPCVHLDQLTGKRLMPHLVWTGGLRARIVEGGVISVGDEIVVSGEASGPVEWEGSIS